MVVTAAIVTGLLIIMLRLVARLMPFYQIVDAMIINDTM